MTEDMTCKELVKLVTDYLEGALPPEQVASFEQHLAVCPGCEIYLEQMRETIRQTGRLREHDVPPETLKQLLETFAAWRDASPAS